MEVGDPTAAERTQRSQLDVVLDKLNDDFAELLETVESGALDQLSAAEKISFWQKFETFRNRPARLSADGREPARPEPR
ncbi:MAG TPA: hypothetical protein VJ301_07320, partial [Propionibacteriaceae bacterium]|nr:hypothetical protein [Propionibacteriaceae bacterium]